METEHKKGRKYKHTKFKMAQRKCYIENLYKMHFKYVQIFKNLKVNSSYPREELNIKLVNNCENYLENF